METKAFIEQRGELIRQLETLAQGAADSGEALNDEQIKKVEDMQAKVERLDKTIESLERSYDKPRVEHVVNESRDRDFAFRAWALEGTPYQRSDYVQAAERVGCNLRVPQVSIQRDTSDAILNSNTANWLPSELSSSVEVAMKDYSGILNSGATVFSTSHGNPFSIPTADDTANSAVKVGEGVSNAVQNTADSKVDFSAYKYSSKFVKVSLEQLADNVFPLAPFIGRIIGERLARTMNSVWTVGAGGTTEPTGVATAAPSVGYTSLVSGSPVVNYYNLLRIIHSVDPAYRNTGRCSWMFNDSVYKQLHELVDEQGRPLFWNSSDSLASGHNNTLLGYSVVVNNDMPSIETGDTGDPCVVFGDMSKFYVRRCGLGDGAVGDVALMRQNERFIEDGIVSFIGLTRTDSQLVDAGQHPVVKLLIGGGSFSNDDLA